MQRGEDKVGQDIYYPIHNFKNFVWIKTGIHIYTRNYMTVFTERLSLISPWLLLVLPCKQTKNVRTILARWKMGTAIQISMV